MTLVWKKHLYQELLKTFFLFLISFYLLYVLMDYSIHAQHFSNSDGFSLFALSTYYLCHFSKRLEILLPLAFLVSFLKVLMQMNQKNELIALFTSGLTKKSFLKPFYYIASLLSLTIFINFEYFVPKSLDYLETFESLNFKDNHLEKLETPSSYFLSLKDGGQIFFQRYLVKEKVFEDVYYMRSLDDLFRIKRLDTSSYPYIGYEVEHFQREEGNNLELIQIEKCIAFENMQVDFAFRKKGILPYEHRPFSDLYLISLKNGCPKEELPLAKTHFYFKLFTPFIPLLLLFIITPFCLSFSRRAPIFLLYSLSLFGFIAFFILLDAAIILGENKVLPPLLALSSPFLIALLGGTCHYSSTRYK